MTRNPQPAPKLTPLSHQYAVELRSLGSNVWRVVAVADDYDTAAGLLLSVPGSGDRRIKKPAHPKPSRAA